MIPPLILLHQHFQMHEHSGEVYQASLNLTVKLIQIGQKQKVVREINPESASKMLWGILYSYIFHRILTKDINPFDENEADQIVDLFMNGVKA